jgi:hypothetical protein
MTTHSIQVYRHIRNGHNGKITNNGGVTLYVEADTNTFAASVAICGDTDNFNANTGRNIAYGRFKKEHYLVEGSYDPAKSLTDNVITALLAQKRLATACSQLCNFLSSEQGTALTKLQRYVKAVPRVPFADPALARENRSKKIAMKAQVTASEAM